MNPDLYLTLLALAALLPVSGAAFVVVLYVKHARASKVMPAVGDVKPMQFLIPFEHISEPPYGFFIQALHVYDGERWVLNEEGKQTVAQMVDTAERMDQHIK